MKEEYTQSTEVFKSFSHSGMSLTGLCLLLEEVFKPETNGQKEEIIK